MNQNDYGEAACKLRDTVTSCVGPGGPGGHLPSSSQWPHSPCMRSMMQARDDVVLGRMIKCVAQSTA